MDITDIDNYIVTKLHSNIKLYSQNKHLLTIYNSLDLSPFKGRLLSDILNTKHAIESLEISRNILFLYKKETSKIMGKYMDYLQIPVNNKNCKQFCNLKKELVAEYFAVIKSCVPYEIMYDLKLDQKININIITCENCDNTDNFINDNDILICNNCYTEVIKMAYYNNRLYNISNNKCNYDRISHFKECIKQYQGKQNTFISPSLYDNIEHAMYTNGIIPGPEVPRDLRFSKVTKSHIMYFLKQLGYNKHYDDYVLIHYNLTGQKPNDISQLESKLVADFEKISEQYGILYNNSDRKNFINIQYILYKLLLKYDFKFDHDDFTNMKSIDRKVERDKICRNIFKALNWDYK